MSVTKILKGHGLFANLSVEDVDSFPLPDPTDPARFVGLREAALHVRDVEQMSIFSWKVRFICICLPLQRNLESSCLM